MSEKDGDMKEVLKVVILIRKIILPLLGRLD